MHAETFSRTNVCTVEALQMNATLGDMYQAIRIAYIVYILYDNTTYDFRLIYRTLIIHKFGVFFLISLLFNRCILRAVRKTFIIIVKI